MKLITFRTISLISVLIISGWDFLGQTKTFGLKQPRLLGKNFKPMQRRSDEESSSNSTVSVADMAMESEGNSTGEVLQGRGSRGVLGFLPGFKLGGGGGSSGGGGGDLLKSLSGGGKGKGLFGSLGLGGKGLLGGGSKEVFPDFPREGGGGGGGEGGYSSGPATSYGENQGGGWSSSSSSSSGSGGSSGGKGGLFSSLFKNPFGGGGGGGKGLFRNPFGGGGGSGGRGPLKILSRLNSDQPCAAGLSSLPILSKLPLIPQSRFPSFIPSGVNTCDQTCGESGGTWKRVPPTKEEESHMDTNSCTYNWRDSFTSFPFLLFRCVCKNKCPGKKVRIGGPFSSYCENVSDKKTRCKCPYGEDTYKCTISLLPVALPLIQRKKPYYCTCCKNDGGDGKENGGWGSPPATSSSGGYSYSAASESSAASSADVFGSYESNAESSGGYQISAASVVGGYAGSTSSIHDNSGAATGTSEAIAETNTQKAVPLGRPLGNENIYDHL